MNDSPRPLTDEDLSAHLDGQGPADLAARLAADPAATARLHELRAAAGAVRDASVAPLDPDPVDDLVGRALAAPEPAAGRPTDQEDQLVVPLAHRRRTGPPWLVAAVVVTLMAVGLGLVWSGTRGGGAEDTATGSSDLGLEVDEAAPESSGDGAAADRDAPGDGASNPPSTTASDGLATAEEAVALPDLGAFETSEDLRASLATAFPASAATTTAASEAGPITDASVDRCAGLLREVLPVEDDPTHVGFARVGSETVLVYEFEASPDPGSTTTTLAGAPPTTLTTAVRPAACDPLFVFQR
jgi:anti-sigma factor RsiW